MIFFCSLDEAGGAGRTAPQRLAVIAEVVQTVLPYNGADESGGRIAKSCSSFSAAKCHGKKQACQWVQGGDFPRPLREILPGH